MEVQIIIFLPPWSNGLHLQNNFVTRTSYSLGYIVEVAIFQLYYLLYSYLFLFKIVDKS